MEQLVSQGARRVLVVEDDPTLCELLRVLLDRPGREVRTAADGLDALRQIRYQDPDVILLDLMLPRMNGFEVVRELAASDSDALQRVIVLTAASESTLKDFHERRVYRVIKKPFDIAELAEAVEACAANRAVKVT